MPLAGLWLGSGYIAFEGCSTGFYGLAEGLGVGVLEMALSVGAPQLAGELIQGGSRAGASGDFEKLVGKHGSPFRDPPREQDGFQAKRRRFPNGGLASIQFFGEDQDCEIN